MRTMISKTTSGTQASCHLTAGVILSSAILMIATSFPVLLTTAAAAPQLENQPGYISAEFIFDTAPFASCHASTLAKLPSGLVAAWFGGTDEGESDVGIWVSRQIDGQWEAPVEVANGVQYTSAKGMHRHPCWNPVLYYANPGDSRKGTLLLFYKVGPNPELWWGMLTTSTDGGKTWDQPRRLPEGIDGPVKNKPIALPGRDLLCGSSTEYDGWRVHLERTSDLGKTWRRIGPLRGKKRSGRENEGIQPSILTYPDGRLQLLCRSHRGKGQILEAWSRDEGGTWSALSETALPNPNSGTDAVTLADGRQLLVYNHTHRGLSFPSGRNMLNVAVSTDGIHWQAALLLERQPGEYSYPAVIQSTNGQSTNGQSTNGQSTNGQSTNGQSTGDLVHITYTWKRHKIRHVVVDPARLKPVTMPAGQWPQGDHGVIQPEE